MMWLYFILREGKLVKYAFTKSNQERFTVTRMCEMMEVSRSAYYDWLKRPDSVYAGDIASIQTGEGWLYLAVLIDLYSKAIVDWAMSERMMAQLVDNALMMAIWKKTELCRSIFTLVG
jgi:transposase InsO family protein